MTQYKLFIDRETRKHDFFSFKIKLTLTITMNKTELFLLILYLKKWIWTKVKRSKSDGTVDSRNRIKRYQTLKCVPYVCLCYLPPEKKRSGKQWMSSFMRMMWMWSKMISWLDKEGVKRCHISEKKTCLSSMDQISTLRWEHFRDRRRPSSSSSSSCS